MDLLAGYASASESDSEAVPVSSTITTIPPSTLPALKTRSVINGTLHTIAYSDATFNQLERLHDSHLPAPTPRKRPRSPKPAEKEKPIPKPTKRQHTPSPPLVPTSTLHLSSTHDYQNRVWKDPFPASRTFAEMESYTPYIPKRRIWQTHAHSRGATTVKFSPGHGHLLLSAGLDGVANVYVTETQTLARSYKGHKGGVRCAEWGDGSFLTGGYDGAVLAWDTEVGKVTSAFRTGSIVYCVRRGQGDEILAACADNKVLQLDLRDANKVVQTYDQHMGAVNSLVFVDDAKTFVTSCDDKVLRVWEYGVPVVIKYISDPSAHSMPVMHVHPNQKWLLCQSMDNTIRIFSARDRFKRRDKMFRGHLVGGYACGMSTSPDGRFVASADSMGRLFFWDWKSSKSFRCLNGHKGVCIDVDWHPTSSSLVASAGWDGNVMLWD